MSIGLFLCYRALAAGTWLAFWTHLVSDHVADGLQYGSALQDGGPRIRERVTCQNKCFPGGMVMQNPSFPGVLATL